MPNESWPALPMSAWADTYATLHMWTQIVGKIRLALSPPVNHWWHVPLYLSARGLTTSALPYEGRTCELSFDFIDDQLRIETSDGDRRTVALAPRTVADFYAHVVQALGELHINVRIWPMPVEIASPIRFDQDRMHAAYDPAWAHRWFGLLQQIDAVFQEFRGRFVGKCSPVHFFWGSFDLAVTRFSGRPAPERDDPIMREAYSQEVISAGFWPGTDGMSDAAFYAYAAPEPPGFKTAAIRPTGAGYRADIGEFLLPYEVMRTAPSPRAALLEFLQSSYEAGADLGDWNRTALERKIAVTALHGQGYSGSKCAKGRGFTAFSNWS